MSSGLTVVKMRDYRPSALISICGSLMHCTKVEPGFPGRARSLERAIVHCPGSSRAKGRERHSTNDVIMEKIEPEAPSSPSLSPSASLPLRCLVLQVTLIVGRSAGRHRVQRCTGEGGGVAVMFLTASAPALGNSCTYIHPVGQVLALLCPSSSSSIPPTFLPLPPTYYLPPGEQEEKRN